MMRRFTLILDADFEEGGYTVTVPALSGCITQGDTVEQCIKRAREAIIGYIESLRIEGEQMPEEHECLQIIAVDIEV